MSRSLFVSGAAGFIGSNFTHWWVQHHPGDQVVALEALTNAGVAASLGQTS